MNIQKDEKILDLCAAPGGKTLAMLQTMLPAEITCRDISISRLDRLKRMLRSYLNESVYNKLIKIELNQPAIGVQPKLSDGLYDKVVFFELGKKQQLHMGDFIFYHSFFSFYFNFF